MTPRSLTDHLGAISALDDPTRRAIWDYIYRAPESVGREEIAEQFGLPRSTAAFHLDRLADQQLLDVEYRKLTGRTGPGSGRPAKLYRRSAAEIAITLPTRHYDLAAGLLADAVERSIKHAVPVDEALASSAREAGERLGAGHGTLTEVLEAHGFEPRTEPDGTVVLGNCPFHRMVADHPHTTCTMNLHLLRGAACACGLSPESLALNPGEGRCCVTIRPSN